MGFNFCLLFSNRPVQYIVRNLYLAANDLMKWGVKSPKQTFREWIMSSAQTCNFVGDLEPEASNLEHLSVDQVSCPPPQIVVKKVVQKVPRSCPKPKVFSCPERTSCAPLPPPMRCAPTTAPAKCLPCKPCDPPKTPTLPEPAVCEPCPKNPDYNNLVPDTNVPGHLPYTASLPPTYSPVVKVEIRDADVLRIVTTAFLGALLAYWIWKAVKLFARFLHYSFSCCCECYLIQSLYTSYAMSRCAQNLKHRRSRGYQKRPRLSRVQIAEDPNLVKGPCSCCKAGVFQVRQNPR